MRLRGWRQPTRLKRAVRCGVSGDVARRGPYVATGFEAGYYTAQIEYLKGSTATWWTTVGR